MAHGKRYREAYEKVDRERHYPPAEAVALIKETAGTKFDETVELHLRLGVNVRHAEEQLRGTLALPHGLGKDVTIAVFAEGDPQGRDAEAAGADFVGGDDLAERVEEGWTDFDVAIATPALMRRRRSSAASSARRARCRTRRSAPSPTTSPRRSASRRPARSSTAPTARRSST